MPIVRFARHLLSHVTAPPECTAAGTTVAEVIHDLERQFPRLTDYVVDEQGRVRKHVNIFIGDRFLADRDRLSDPVTPDSVIHIMQALSGG